jgi:hypothetical protein
MTPTPITITHLGAEIQRLNRYSIHAGPGC